MMSYHHPCLGPVYGKVTSVRKEKKGLETCNWTKAKVTAVMAWWVKYLKI